jgi:hypothetical protein
MEKRFFPPRMFFFHFVIITVCLYVYCVRRVICETGGGYRITVRTSRPIKKGEEIFNTYLDILQPTLLRQSLLAESKLMHCW